jgi:hypothetical protein
MMLKFWGFVLRIWARVFWPSSQRSTFGSNDAQESEWHNSPFFGRHQEICLIRSRAGETPTPLHRAIELQSSNIVEVMSGFYQGCLVKPLRFLLSISV